jgi:hypothetical protein
MQLTGKCALAQALEEARAQYESSLLELDCLKKDLVTASTPTLPRGPTAHEILEAIQIVKHSAGEDTPFTLSLFSNALSNNQRVAQLLHADNELQKQAAIEAIQVLERSHAEQNLAHDSANPISNSVILNLFFSPEAETERLLRNMQKTESQIPSWELDHKWQNKALATLETSLKNKLEQYIKFDTEITPKLTTVRREIAEREEEERQELELTAALVSAQREQNAVKLQLKSELQRNEQLRQSLVSIAVS